MATLLKGSGLLTGEQVVSLFQSVMESGKGRVTWISLKYGHMAVQETGKIGDQGRFVQLQAFRFIATVKICS